jgi:Cu-Zn family superoxide dismutase
MTTLLFALALAALVALPGPAAANPKTTNTAEVHLQNADSESVGKVMLRDTPHGVLMELDLTNLPPGEHAFHIHEKGQCKPPFETAGGHLNPTSRQHGFEATTGAHAGDLPNLTVSADGTVKVEVLARDVRLTDASGKGLLDADGSSLVVHAKADDHKTDPAGNSGDRIACGIVARPETH